MQDQVDRDIFPSEAPAKTLILLNSYSFVL
jgi:hypothetical protein